METLSPAVTGTVVQVKKILLVEDNPADAWLFERVFLKYGDGGFHIARETFLQVALKRLSREPFDLVLLDLVLPGSQGLSSLFQVLLSHPEVPVVVLTGISDEATALQALRWGAQDYVAKNSVFDRDSLVRIARYAIERQKHHVHSRP